MHIEMHSMPNQSFQVSHQYDTTRTPRNIRIDAGSMLKLDKYLIAFVGYLYDIWYRRYSALGNPGTAGYSSRLARCFCGSEVMS